MIASIEERARTTKRAEFGSTVWATALTRDPRRVSQISARFVVLAFASLLAITAGIAGWSIVTAIAVPGEGGPSVDEWLSLVWKVGLIELAWTAIGLGAVAQLPIGRAAIGAALALYFIDPILGLWGPWENRVPVRGHQRPFPDRHRRRVRCIRPGTDLSLSHAVTVMLGWTALGLFLTWWGLHRRDA